MRCRVLPASRQFVVVLTEAARSPSLIEIEQRCENPPDAPAAGKGGAQTQAVGVTKGGPEVAKSKRSLTNSVGPGSLSSHRATPADCAMEPAV